MFTLELIKKHKQPFIAAVLAVIILLAFGVTSLVGFIRDFDKSEADKLKERADKYFSTSDFRNAVNLYNMALELDPAYEEIYIILHDYYSDIDERYEVLYILERAVINTDSAKLHALYENADRRMIFPNDNVEAYFRRRDYFVRFTFNEWGEFISYGEAPEPLEGELWQSDFDDLTHFSFSELVDDLSFFKQFRNLEGLTVLADGESDLSALSELTNLKGISFTTRNTSNKPFVLPSLSKLTQLEALSFDRVELTNYSVLKELPPSVALFFSCDLRNDYTTDFSQLAELQGLSQLYLQCNYSTEDLSFLGAFRENENLYISLMLSDALPDLSSLYDFAGTLEITYSPLSDPDLSALSGLTALKRLYVHDSRLYTFTLDLSPLANLTNLQGLDLGLWNSSVLDISPLANLKKLQGLTLPLVESGDLSPLTELTALTSLSISDGRKEDAVPYDLSPLSALTELTYLSIGGGHFGEFYDLSPLANLTRLEILYLPPRVDDISALSNLTSLFDLSVNNANNLTDISALENLTSLRRLSLQRCSKIYDITPLAGLVNLRYLDLTVTGVTNVQALAGMSEDLELRIDLFKIADTSPIQHIIDKGGANNPNIYIQIN